MRFAPQSALAVAMASGLAAASSIDERAYITGDVSALANLAEPVSARVSLDADISGKVLVAGVVPSVHAGASVSAGSTASVDAGADVNADVEVSVICNDCHTRGNIEASVSLESAVPALELVITDIEAKLDLDIKASAAANIAVNLLAVTAADLPFLGLELDATVFLDLVLGLSTEIDLSAGLEVELVEAAHLSTNILNGDILASSFTGLEVTVLPIQVRIGCTEVHATLRLRVELDAEVETGAVLPILNAVPEIGAGLELSVYVNLVEYIGLFCPVEACPLLSDSYGLNVGAIAELDVSVEDVAHIHLAPTVSLALLEVPATTHCPTEIIPHLPIRGGVTASLTGAVTGPTMPAGPGGPGGPAVSVPVGGAGGSPLPIPTGPAISMPAGPGGPIPTPVGPGGPGPAISIPVGGAGSYPVSIPVGGAGGAPLPIPTLAGPGGPGPAISIPVGGAPLPTPVGPGGPGPAISIPVGGAGGSPLPIPTGPAVSMPAGGAGSYPISMPAGPGGPIIPVSIPAGHVVSTVTQTATYTVTACAVNVANCPGGFQSATTLTQTTTYTTVVPSTVTVTDMFPKPTSAESPTATTTITHATAVPCSSASTFVPPTDVTVPATSASATLPATEMPSTSSTVQSTSEAMPTESATAAGYPVVSVTSPAAGTSMTAPAGGASATSSAGGSGESYPTGGSGESYPVGGSGKTYPVRSAETYEAEQLSTAAGYPTTSVHYSIATMTTHSVAATGGVYPTKPADNSTGSHPTETPVPVAAASKQVVGGAVLAVAGAMLALF